MVNNQEEYIMTFDSASPEVCEALVEEINQAISNIFERSYGDE